MRALECLPVDAGPHLGPVFGRKANPRRLDDMSELLRDCRCYRVFDDSGQIVAAYALRGVGGEIWIQAAAGRATVDLCDLFDDIVPKHGPGFDTIGFRTYRRGLKKKAQDRGYQLVNDTDGYTMRKTIK